MVQVAEDVDVLYREFFPTLVRIGVRERNLAHADAEALAQDVFIEFIARIETVEDYRAYLAGAMYHASARFAKRHRRITYGFEPSGIGEDDGTIERHVLTVQSLAKLTPRCERALRLRYLDGHTVPELATLLTTTVKYAEKVVRECLQQARKRNGVTA